MKRKEIVERVVHWLQKAVGSGGCNGGIVGLSGGIDSAVVAALCKSAFPDDTLGVIMPCYSSPEDKNDAYLVADTFKLKVQEVALDDVYTTLIKELGSPSQVMQENPLAAANIKPRLRMTTLYYLASLHKYMVIGTGNKSELYIGYFTKYGDGGVDLEPIGGLLKTEVRELARSLGVPEKIIEKDPTAGLWQGQSDEDEMGVTYDELDKFITTGKAPDPSIEKKLKELHNASEHKRKMPPICAVEDLL